MKLILRILFLILLAFVAAACASSTTPTAQPEAASTVPPQATSDQGYVPSDVSMVANTGRPQFLDSYADW